MMTFLTILGIICMIIVTAEVALLLFAMYGLRSNGYSIKEFFKTGFLHGYHYMDEDLQEEEPQLTIDSSEIVDDESATERRKRHEELDAEVDALLGR